MRAALWMCTLTALPAVVRAQTPPDSSHAGERHFGIWAGASLSAAAAFGTITDRRLVLTGLRYERTIETRGSVTTAYTFDLHPIAVVTNTPQYSEQQIRARNGIVFNQIVETGRSPVVGAGFSPLGLQLYSARFGNARLFGGGSAGGIWFNRDMPMAGARRFNFALQLGTGVELTARSGASLVLGYKFHHLSNAGTAQVNPGMDGHLLYVGLMRRRGTPLETIAKAARDERPSAGTENQPE
jgi:hypothetical protein